MTSCLAGARGRTDATLRLYGGCKSRFLAATTRTKKRRTWDPACLTRDCAAKRETVRLRPKVPRSRNSGARDERAGDCRQTVRSHAALHEDKVSQGGSAKTMAPENEAALPPWVNESSAGVSRQIAIAAER